MGEAMLTGCDISHWQGAVDFARMKQAGAAFVICKASQAAWTDSRFASNWRAAKAAGLLRGAYHFLVWDVPAKTQVRHFWGLLQADPPDLPPVVDFEWNPNTDTPSGAVAILADFVAELEQLCGRAPMIYTSLGFWLPHGAKNDPRWARYPLWVAHYTVDAKPIWPAPWQDWALWQFTSSGNGAAYGVSSKEIDLNRTSAVKLAELIQAAPPEEPDEEDADMYKGLPLGYITSNITDVGWGNTGFSFYVGLAGSGMSEPNPNLKPIEEKAAGLKKPFLALWDYHPQYYMDQQYVPDDAHWPPPDQDWPYRKCIEAIQHRDCKAVIVRVMDNINKADGKVIDKHWLSYSAQVFCGRVADWLARNKPGCKLILATSYPFISANAPGIANWADKYAQVITEPAGALVESYPADNAKPGYLANNRWDLWQYRSNLVLSWRDQAALYQWLGFSGGTTPPPPPDPEPEPEPEPTGDYAAVLTALGKLSDKLDEISARLEVVEGGVCNADETLHKIFRIED